MYNVLIMLSVSRFLRLGVWLVVLGSLAGGVITYAVTDHFKIIFPITSALAVSTALLNLGAIPLFVAGLKGFKSELRHAYTLLCIGIALFGLAHVQLPVLSWFNWWLWADIGGVALPYLFAVVFIFAGTRQYAYLLNIKSRWTSWHWAIGSALMLAILATFLPHVKSEVPEYLFKASTALSIWDTAFMGFATVATWSIRKHISHMYVRSMTILFVAFLVITIAGLHYSTIILLLTEGNWYFDNSIVLIPFMLGALLLVWAGYVFNTIKADVRSVSSGLLSVDVIVYMAELASNQCDIDIILDQLRGVTSRLRPGIQLSTEDTATLDGIYRQLENYLTTEEPLRIYTAEGLRQDIQHHFTLDPQTEVWIHGPANN